MFPDHRRVQWVDDIIEAIGSIWACWKRTSLGQRSCAPRRCECHIVACRPICAVAWALVSHDVEWEVRIALEKRSHLCDPCHFCNWSLEFRSSIGLSSKQEEKVCHRQNYAQNDIKSKLTSAIMWSNSIGLELSINDRSIFKRSNSESNFLSLAWK